VTTPKASIAYPKTPSKKIVRTPFPTPKYKASAAKEGAAITTVEKYEPKLAPGTSKNREAK
jgi:hypothetical protein